MLPRGSMANSGPAPGTGFLQKDVRASAAKSLVSRGMKRSAASTKARLKRLGQFGAFDTQQSMKSLPGIVPSQSPPPARQQSSSSVAAAAFAEAVAQRPVTPDSAAPAQPPVSTPSLPWVDTGAVASIPMAWADGDASFRDSGRATTTPALLLRSPGRREPAPTAAPAGGSPLASAHSASTSHSHSASALPSAPSLSSTPLHASASASQLPPQEVAKNRALMDKTAAAADRLEKALLVAANAQLKPSLKARRRPASAAATSPVGGVAHESTAAAKATSSPHTQPRQGKPKRAKRRPATAGAAAREAVLAGLSRSGGSPKRNARLDTVLEKRRRRLALQKRKAKAAAAAKAKQEAADAAAAAAAAVAAGGREERGGGVQARPDWYTPLSELQQRGIGSRSGGLGMGVVSTKWGLRRRGVRGARVVRDVVGPGTPPAGLPRRSAPHTASAAGTTTAEGAPAGMGGSSPSHAATADSPLHASTTHGSPVALRVHWSPTLHAKSGGLTVPANLDPVQAQLRSVTLGHGGPKRMGDGNRGSTPETGEGGSPPPGTPQQKSRGSPPRHAASLRTAASAAAATTSWRVRDDYPRVLHSANAGWQPSPLTQGGVTYVDSLRPRATHPPVVLNTPFSPDSAVHPAMFGAGGEQGEEGGGGLEDVDAASPRSDTSALTQGSADTAVVMAHLDELVASHGVGHSLLPTPRLRSAASAATLEHSLAARPEHTSTSQGTGPPPTPSRRSGTALSSSSASHRLRATLQASRQRVRSQAPDSTQQQAAEEAAGGYREVLRSISSSVSLRPSSVPALVKLHKARVRTALARSRLTSAQAAARERVGLEVGRAVSAGGGVQGSVPHAEDPVDTVMLEGEEEGDVRDVAAEVSTATAAEAAALAHQEAALDDAIAEVGRMRGSRVSRPLPGPFPSKPGRPYRPALRSEGDRRAYALWASGMHDFSSDRADMPRPGDGVSLQATPGVWVAWMLDMARADPAVASRLAQRVGAYDLQRQQDQSLKGSRSLDGLSVLARNAQASTVAAAKPASRAQARAQSAAERSRRAAAAAARRKVAEAERLDRLHTVTQRTERMVRLRWTNERVMTWVYLVSLLRGAGEWRRRLDRARLLRPSSTLGNAAALVLQRCWRGHVQRAWVASLRKARPLLARLVSHWRLRRRARRVRRAATMLQGFLCDHVLALGAGGIAWAKYIHVFLGRVRVAQRAVRGWLACRAARLAALRRLWAHLVREEVAETSQRKAALAGALGQVARVGQDAWAGEVAVAKQALAASGLDAVFTACTPGQTTLVLRRFLAVQRRAYNEARRRWVRAHGALWDEVVATGSTLGSPEAGAAGQARSGFSAAPTVVQASPTSAARTVATTTSLATLTTQVAFGRRDLVTPKGHKQGHQQEQDAAPSLIRPRTVGAPLLDDPSLAGIVAMSQEERRAFLQQLAMGPATVQLSPQARTAVGWVSAPVRARILCIQSHRGGLFTLAPWQAILRRTVPSGTQNTVDTPPPPSPPARPAQTASDSLPASPASPASSRSGAPPPTSPKRETPARQTPRRSRRASTKARRRPSSRTRSPSSRRGSASPLSLPAAALEAPPPLLKPRGGARKQQFAGRPPVLHVYGPRYAVRMTLQRLVLALRRHLAKRDSVPA